jgi:hypothetical protein
MLELPHIVTTNMKKIRCLKTDFHLRLIPTVASHATFHAFHQNICPNNITSIYIWPQNCYPLRAPEAEES